MAGEIEVTDEFIAWWSRLSEMQQDKATATVEILADWQTAMPYPHSSQINSSRHSHMRELRIRSGSSHIRIFYAFDPRRTGILLIGGDKTGHDRFYEHFVPKADALYDEYLVELEKEGLLP